ncbi:MAG TPA: EamA family transporter, partial [Candidatus Limnocylindrales bacterium]
MSLFVFGLVALAAVMHATWNVVLKTAGDPLRTSGRITIAGVAAGLPIALVAWVAVGAPSIPAGALGLGIVSGVLEFLYFVSLSAAYRRGEISVVYPIARGTAPLLAVIAGVVILGERLGTVGALGVAALAAGILVIQQPWRALGAGGSRTRRPGGAVAFAIATGVIIAAYSAVDRVGARLVEPWLFAAILFPVAAVLLAAWIRFVDRPGHRFVSATRAADPLAAAPWPRSVAAGLLATGAYVLVLVAYTLAPLSVVAPLRESAVVLVSGWGSFRLREAT